MVSNSIWMDSGAMVSMIPEMDLYLGPFASIASASNNQRTITLDSNFTNLYTLVSDLYVGCYLRIHKVATGGGVDADTLIDRVMIQSNASGTITVNDSLSSVITATASDYYGVIEHFGSPVPAPKGTAGIGYVAQSLTVEFKSDTASDYNDVGIIFGVLGTVGGGEKDVGIFFTSDGSFADAASLTGQTEYDITVNISSSELTSAEEYIDAAISAIGLVDVDDTDVGTEPDFTATRVGNTLVLTNVYGGALTRTPGTDDGDSGSTIGSLTTASTSIIEMTVTTAGASDSGTNPRLLSDTWLGLTDSVSIPSTSIETKGIPVSTGSRSMVYQFKGMETTSGGSFSVTSNNFSWLYYALGNKEITTVTSETTDTANGDAHLKYYVSVNSGTNNFIRDTTTTTSANSGFHRVIGQTICPPLNPELGASAAGSNIKRVNLTDFENKKITYGFSESNSEDLPTFALEYTLKKPDSQSTVAVDSSKETVYSKIYPGCMVSSLTLDASANQEVKMNVNFETKKTFVAPTNYETANNQTSVKDFVNFGSPQGGSANEKENLLRPFFFSDGVISMFGQDYIRIETMSLEINNSLTPKRFVGKYDKTSQFHFPGQRTYNLSFTGLVTDSAVFDALRRTEAYSLSGTTGNELTLRFTKDLATDEVLEMKFEDYMVTSAEFPLTNDKGPITVNWTIVPLRLKSCTHTTNWIIQG